MADRTILCIASYFKGRRFMEAAAGAGCRVLLLTDQRLADEDWPMDAVSERFLMPDLQNVPDVVKAVSYLSRTTRIDRIVALDEYDTMTAARLREHMRLPGMGVTTAGYFRDKLAMRARAEDAGIAAPGFCGLFHTPDVRSFLETTSGPWLIKPRTEASAMGIRKVGSAAEAMALVEGMGDERSFQLIEQFVPGAIAHVDSIVENGRVAFRKASRYGRPPLDVYQGGGVFVTRTLDDESELAGRLFEANERLMQAFGMVRGATHAEFIVTEAGEVLFLEVAARVGGANIDLLIESATGLNIWEEWARLEAARLEGRTYNSPESANRHAALLTCLSRDEWPDLGAYDAPEIVWRLNKRHHAGLILAGEDLDVIDRLLDEYSRRFGEQFLAIEPPKKSAAEDF